MKPQVSLVRAIGSEFGARKLKSVLLVTGIILIIFVGIAIWLITMSAWWWLFAIPVILFSLFSIAAYLIARIVIKRLRPDLTKSQTSAVSSFVDKLERVADNLQTPMFIIVFKVVRDIIRPRSKPFVQTIVEDSSTLHKDLLELQKNFS